MSHRHPAGIVAAVVLLWVATGAHPVAQSAEAERHFAAAKAAAQTDHLAIFDSTCGTVQPSLLSTPATPSRTVAADRASWHAEPVKVFDNLYFLGQTEYSAWAVTTSDGIIIMDAIFDYSVEDEVINGLTKLGLDPKQIKYVIVSHAHGDHVGGARVLQDRGAKIVMSAADWDLMDKANVAFAKPKRDVVAADGQKLTLGDTTLTMYITGGHTLGTISTIIPVKDRGMTYQAAYWGGTAFNWARGSAGYITPERPARFWYETYAASAKRFKDIAGKVGASVLLSNHTSYDRTAIKTKALASRAANAPNPYVIGAPAVQRFLTVAQECAEAGVAASGNSTK